MKQVGKRKGAGRKPAPYQTKNLTNTTILTMTTSAQYTFAFTDMIGRRHHCIITVISNSYESAYKLAYEQAEQFLLVPMDA